MKTKSTHNSILWKILLIPILILFAFPSVVLSEETYVFERMWPTLQQPWYFSFTPDIAVDSTGFVYVSEDAGSRIIVLDSDGHFIREWGHNEFKGPSGISIDTNGDLYVVDSRNHRIQKFTSDGQFLTKWGHLGEGEGEFQDPEGIVINQEGDIYVADRRNHRIQKLTKDGDFITEWGGYGEGDGEFMYPAYLAIDSKGNVYVGERAEADVLANFRIQKFTSNGEFITKWGSYGGNEGEFHKPGGIAIDEEDNVYVVEKGDNIHKFTSDGQTIFHIATSVGWGIALDGKGHIFTSGHNEVTKHSTDGQALAVWGARSVQKVLHDMPMGMALDIEGNIYLTTYINTAYKLKPDGEILHEWDLNPPEADGIGLHGMAVNTGGDAYVSSRCRL